MEFIRRGRLLTYIIFMAVNIFYSPYLGANYSFSSHFDGSKATTKNFLKTPDTDLEKSLHSCVEELCQDLSSEKTYKAYFEAATLLASKSDFFDKEIMPILRGQFKIGQSLLEEAEDFLEKVRKMDADIELTETQRNILAFDRALRLIDNYQHLPVVENMVEIGPTKLPTDMSFYLGHEFDEARFNRLKADGIYKESDKDILKAYIENRNLESVFPFISSSKDQFATILNTHGKGAKSLFENALYRIDQGMKDPEIFPFPTYAFYFDFMSSAISKFIKNNFSTLVKMKNVSDFHPNFSNFIFRSQTTIEFFKTAGHLITPDEFDIGKKISKAEIEKVANNMEAHIDWQKTELTSDNFEEKMSRTCRWKMNFLYESLPSKEELDFADQKVTHSIVKFQNWMFDRISPGTATSIFDFLRSWSFFMPPTKEEFSRFVKNFLRSDRKSWYFSQDPSEIPVILSLLSHYPNRWSRNYHGLDGIEHFCKTLKLNPMGDNADAERAQVYLGWMALKDESLIESVVWHELGHIVSSLMRGRYKLDIIPFLTGSLKEFSVSLGSFTKYMSSLQCLGKNQEQKKNFNHLGEPYLSWFKDGLLSQFDNSPDVQYKLPSLPPSSLNIGEMGLYNFEVTQEHEIMGSSLFIRNVSTGVLSFISGEFIEEDWADLVAADLSKSNTNPFCFILKDQDHLFWHEKKGMDNDEIPWINNLKEQLRRSQKEEEVSFSKEQMDYFNAGHGKHSTLFYRLLHVETVRSGILPPSCQKAKKLRKDYSDIKKCDYF